MREYMKLFVVAAIASVVTLVATTLIQSKPVQAAPASDTLPPDFKAGYSLTFGSSGSGGTIVSTYGEWVKLKGEEEWWINVNHPDVYYTLEKGE